VVELTVRRAVAAVELGLQILPERVFAAAPVDLAQGIDEAAGLGVAVEAEEADVAVWGGTTRDPVYSNGSAHDPLRW
jgi:hypothetical protein